jgi:hypothetical protein
MKTIAALFLVVASCFPVAAQCPLSSVISVEGKADEWNLTWEDDEEKNFSYNVCSDDKNLYLRVKTEEFYTKRKLAAFGFTVWFDPSGKKKRKYGLKFPCGGSEAEERMAVLNKEGAQANTLGEKTDFQKHADSELIANLEILELIGLADDPVTSTRSGITNGIKVAIAMDENGAYVYEAIIPFRSYRLNGADITELSIGFETGKYEAPKQKPTTKNSPVGSDLTPSQLSRMQGYGNSQGNPKLIYPSTAWTKVVLKK